MKYLLPLLFLVGFYPLAFSQNVDYAGTSVANFLKIGVSARTMAMGDAGITQSEDASALFWNPGAISRIPSNSLHLSTVNWLVDTKVAYGAVVLHAGGMGTIGLDLDFFSSGDIEETTLTQQDGTGRYFSASDLQLGLTLARNMTDRFSVGFKIKYIQEKLANVQAGAFAFDIGAVFITSFLNNMRLAATLSNFGPKMQFTGRDLTVIYPIPGSPAGKEVPAYLKTLEWELPLLFRFGLSDYLLKRDDFSVLWAVDVLDSRDHDARFNVGTELGIYRSLFIRAGYKFNYEESNYSLGAGFDLRRVLKWNARLDYAFLSFGRFEPVSQFSLRLNF